MAEKLIFTVFTPTFNRAHTLGRVYKSLRNQTFTNFEWIIVDDGSVDNTASLVKNWKKEEAFKITYRWQKNKGKHVAINNGVSLAKGSLFIIADSDDSFPPNALNDFIRFWYDIDCKVRNNYTGVTGLCIHENGEIVGDSYPSDVFDSTPQETFYSYGIRGEKWGFHRTSVLKKFPFPEIEGISHYPEGLIWNKIGRCYTTRYVNTVVRCYHQDSGDQLTRKNASQISNMRKFYFQALNEDVDFLKKAPLQFFKISTQAVRLSLHQSEFLRIQYSQLEYSLLKLLWLISLPLGLALFLADKVQDK